MADEAHGRSAAVGPRALDRLEVVLDRLHKPPLVPRRVAEAGIDAVEPLVGLLGELDASLLELVGRLAAVRRPEDARAHRAARDQSHDLLGALGIDRRRDRRAEDDVDVGLVAGSDCEPAVAAELFERGVLTHLEAELLGVEGLGLVLVVYPNADVRDRVDHCFRSFPSDLTYDADPSQPVTSCLLETRQLPPAAPRPSRSRAGSGRRPTDRRTPCERWSA